MDDLDRRVCVGKSTEEPEIVFVHKGVACDFDNPSNEETARQQGLADEAMGIRTPVPYTPMTDKELDALVDGHEKRVLAKYLIGKLTHVGSHKQRVAWLKEAGYTGVNVKGNPEPVALERAEERYVRAMYLSEVERQKRILGE
jgi:hypothetical protein